MVRNEKTGRTIVRCRTIVRFGMAALVFVFVRDSGKGNRYQIITDTHRNYHASELDVDPIVPQGRSPPSKAQSFKNDS